MRATKALYDGQPLKSVKELLARADAVEVSGRYVF